MSSLPARFSPSVLFHTFCSKLSHFIPYHNAQTITSEKEAVLPPSSTLRQKKKKKKQKQKRSLSPGGNTAETLPDRRLVIHRKEDVDDQAVDQASQIIQRQDREVRSIVPTRNGLFDNAHDLDVTGGSFMAAGGNINIYHNALPPNSAPPADSDSPDQHTLSSSDSSARSSVIYHRNLITKRRGSPLWIPEPDNTSPTSYQRKGVSFGDVGLLSPSGSFDFFFNICYPSDDPINSGGVPEGFKPFKLSSLRIRGAREFEAASYVASESIKISRKQYSDSSTADLVFESSAAEGAILTMPHGAQSEDVVGTLLLRGYVLEHIESWYKLIMGDLGCDVQNGDIVVVTGCDKTDSWGLATFVKSSETVKLTFQPILSNRSYKWEYSGSFDTRTGPDSRTLQGLQSSTNDMDMVSSEPLRNQCVFVRTLTCTLRDDIWKSLRRSVCLRLGLDPDKDVYQEESFMRGDGPGTSSPSGGSTNNGNSMQGRWSGQQRQHLPALQPSISLVSNVSTTMMNHPSKLLNQFLWTNSGHEYPLARVVITEDRDWISVLRDDDLTLPDVEELYRRITEHKMEIAENPGDDFLTLSFTPRPGSGRMSSESNIDAEMANLTLNDTLRPAISRVKSAPPPEDASPGNSNHTPPISDPNPKVAESTQDLPAHLRYPFAYANSAVPPFSSQYSPYRPNKHTIADALRQMPDVFFAHAVGSLAPQGPESTYESYTARAPPNMYGTRMQQSDNKNEGKEKKADDSKKKDKKDKNTTAGAK
ncbi:hypothetical protein CPC08DRAFT_752970 [Agrocybe pediades]|nr:hypothetical protein CPC08DRAFT_752970 [Agrocybe pediades]